MLSEFALSPAVFRTASYESATVADLCIRHMGLALREDCVVRDLCSGEWSGQLDRDKELLHKKARELLKKLKRDNRLVHHPQTRPLIPDNDPSWEEEAILSHIELPLTGCVFSQLAKEERYRNQPLVSCPERLLSTLFWANRTCSRRISRSIEAYVDLLSPLLRHANDIMFIDPHLDPSEKHYSDFWKILAHQMLTNRIVKSKVEIHRVAWKGESKNKLPRVEEIKTAFIKPSDKPWYSVSLDQRLKEAGLSAEVFLWDDFHDRFFLTDLMGMSWSNGFDTSKAVSASVTVARMDRSDRDEVQEEFAANSIRHRLQGRFKIGYGITT